MAGRSEHPLEFFSWHSSHNLSPFLVPKRTANCRSNAKLGRSFLVMKAMNSSHQSEWRHTAAPPIKISQSQIYTTLVPNVCLSVPLLSTQRVMECQRAAPFGASDLTSSSEWRPEGNTLEVLFYVSNVQCRDKLVDWIDSPSLQFWPEKVKWHWISNSATDFL